MELKDFLVKLVKMNKKEHGDPIAAGFRYASKSRGLGYDYFTSLPDAKNFWRKNLKSKGSKMFRCMKCQKMTAYKDMVWKYYLKITCGVCPECAKELDKTGRPTIEKEIRKNVSIRVTDENKKLILSMFDTFQGFIDDTIERLKKGKTPKKRKSRNSP